MFICKLPVKYRHSCSSESSSTFPYFKRGSVEYQNGLSICYRRTRWHCCAKLQICGGSGTLSTYSSLSFSHSLTAICVYNVLVVVSCYLARLSPQCRRRRWSDSDRSMTGRYRSLTGPRTACGLPRPRLNGALVGCRLVRGHETLMDNRVRTRRHTTKNNGY